MYKRQVLDEFNFKATFYIPARNVDEANILWHDRIGYCTLNAKNSGSEAMKKVLILAEAYGVPSKVTDSFESHIIQNSKKIAPEKRTEFIENLENILKVTTPAWGRLMTWSEIRQIHQQGQDVYKRQIYHLS